jgi:oligosaccharide repeat unit polymerase
MTFRRLNSSVLSPLLLFPLVWAGMALLAQIHLLRIQGSWSTVMVAVVVAVPLTFIAGGLIGEGIAQLSTRVSAKRRETKISERTFRRVLLVLVGIGLLAVAYQFARAGKPPLLSGSIDNARFSEGGPTILLTDLLTVAVIAAMTRARNPFSRESRFELLLSAIALGAFALQAGRGNVVLPVVVVILARWLYWGRPSPYLLTAGAVVAFLAICFGFYLRTYQHPTTPFEAELFSEVLPQLPFFVKPLIPLYLALTTNFVALEGIVHHFPTTAPFGHGAYDAVALDRFVSVSKNVSDVSGELTPPWVTSTVAGSFWADGGFWVVVPGVALTGAFTSGAYAAAARTHSFRWSLVAAYLLFVALFGLYTNLWTQQIDWLVVTTLLFVVAAFAEDPQSPPGIVGTAWGKIRQISASGSTSSSTPPAVVTGGDPTGSAKDNGLGGRAAKSAILCGLIGVIVLLVAGLIVQRTLPEPFPLVKTMPLPRSIATAESVFTDSGRGSDNTQVYWVNQHGPRATLHVFDPVSRKTRATAFHPSNLPGKAYYDTGSWLPMAIPAIFEIQQAPTKIYVTVRRSDNGAPVKRFSRTLNAPVPGVTRSFEIASFDPPRADLFMVDRGLSTARARLSILSGESGFRAQAYGTNLPFRGAKPDEWSLGVGELAGKTLPNGRVATPKPDLLLFERDPDHEHTSLKVIAGEESYIGFAYQRDIDEPGDLPPSRIFLQGSWIGAPSVFEVAPEAPGGPELRIFDIQPPAGLL